MKNGIKGSINWHTKHVLLRERVYLFCFGEKCMSGRINYISKILLSEEFEITVEFIEPDYFRDEAVIGGRFSIREGFTILGEGEVKLIL